MKKYFPFLLFVLILSLAVFLRLFLLGQVPAGLTNDEANTGYDAYSLLLTGKDQWGVHMPLIFKGFGDYPPPLYRYLTTGSVALFGLNSFAIRLPAALLSILFVVVIFFLVKKVFSRRHAFISMLLLVFSPWAIGLGRVAIESGVAACFLLFGIFFFFTQKKISWSIFASVCFLVLTLYTYSAYTLFAPLVFLTLLVYGYLSKRLPTKYMLIAVIFFTLLVSPLFLTKNTSAGARFSQIGILSNISSIGIVNTLNDQRGACLRYIPSTLCKVEYNKILVFSSNFVTNYLSHFSVNFLFLSGTQTQFSILPQRGLDYLLSSILLLAGCFYLLTAKSKQKLFLLFLLLSPIPDSLTGDGNYSRAFVMLPFLVIIEGYAGSLFLEKIKQLSLPSKLATQTIVCLVICIGVTSFCITYFTYFRDYYSRFSQYGYRTLMLDVKNNAASYEQIYITSHLNDTKQYIYYLLYTKYNPSLYQKKADVSYSTQADGWISIDRIGNIYFVPSLPDSKTLNVLRQEKKKILLVSHPSDFPKVTAQFVVKDRIGYGLFEGANMAKLPDYFFTSQDKQQ